MRWQALFSETGMLIARLIRSVDTDDSMNVQVEWKDISSTDDILEQIIHVFEVVLDLLSGHCRVKTLCEPSWRKHELYSAFDQ